MRKIRRALSDDSFELARVHVDSFTKAYKNIIPDKFLSSFTVKNRQNIFKNRIEQEQEETYLIEEKDNICGFITIGKCRDDDKPKFSGEIWGVYVSSKYWRKGYGKMLLEYGEKLLVQRGFKKIFLWVLKDNLPSRNFYEYSGYNIEGSKKIIKNLGNIESIMYYKDFK